MGQTHGAQKNILQTYVEELKICTELKIYNDIPKDTHLRDQDDNLLRPE